MKLVARACRFCRKPKGTICFRQDGGAFFAHLQCFRKYRKSLPKDK